jgi:hypothetical protein
MEETGRALTASPYAAGLLASLAVMRLGSEAHAGRAAAWHRVRRAGGHPRARRAASAAGRPGLQTTAHVRGDAVTLTGTKTLGRARPTADVLLVSRDGGDAPAARRASTSSAGTRPA